MQPGSGNAAESVSKVVRSEFYPVRDLDKCGVCEPHIPRNGANDACVDLLINSSKQPCEISGISLSIVFC